MKKKRIGRPPSPHGTPPIRGQMRWHDDEWEQIQAALKATGETYSAFVRRLVLPAIRRMARTELGEGKAGKAGKASKGKGKT